MCKIASYLKKTSDNWPFVVRTEKVRLFLFRAYLTQPFPVINIDYRTLLIWIIYTVTSTFPLILFCAL